MAETPRPRRSAIERIAKIVLGLGVLALPALALRHINLGLVGASILAIPHSTLLLALVVSLFQIVALATRLWSVFPDKTRPGWARVARAFGFGQLANACLPGRAGDVVKVVAISKDEGGEDAVAAGHARPAPATSAADATGVMLADKALDFTTLGALVLVFAPALLVGLLAGAAHVAPIAGATALVAVVIGFALHRWWPTAFAKLWRGANATWAALRSLLTPSRLATGLTLGCTAWLAEAGSMMILGSPMGVHLSLAQAIMGLLVLNVGIAVPVAPGNVGAYEAATVVGLAPFGVPPAQALALGALHHVVQLATIGGVALCFWVRDRSAKWLRLRARRPVMAVPRQLPSASAHRPAVQNQTTALPIA